MSDALARRDILRRVRRAGISRIAKRGQLKSRPSTVVAYIRWFDSSITQGMTVDAADAAGVLENESAGVVVKEDRKCITIAMDRCLGTQGLRCTLCVPKVNIRSIKRFRVAVK